MSSFFADDGGSVAGADHSEELGDPTLDPSHQVSSNGQSFHGPSVGVVVIEPDDFNRERILAQTNDDAHSIAGIDELTPLLRGEPVVLVLGPSCADDASLASIEPILHRHREVGAILVAEELTTSLLQQALRAGVKDVLSAPADRDQLAEAILRVANSLVVPSAVVPDDEEVFEPDGDLAHVITVFSTKGGAGKSVIATNLGVALARRSDKPVCLVDADLQFGDIAVMLKLAPQHTIVDAVSSLDRLDITLLQNLLITHESSGLKVLAAPLEPAFADQIGAAEMVQIVEVLKQFCSYVIIDTPAYFNDVVLGMIETSDDVLLVAGMDVPSIKNVKIGLQTLRLLNTPMEKLRLVLNRANSKVKLDVTEVERTLQVSADVLIPSDIVVPQSVNRGVPVVESARRSGVAKAMEEMADLFCPKGAQPKRGRR